jgi:hypothetical protein
VEQPGSRKRKIPMMDTKKLNVRGKEFVMSPLEIVNAMKDTLGLLVKEVKFTTHTTLLWLLGLIVSPPSFQMFAQMIAMEKDSVKQCVISLSTAGRVWSTPIGIAYQRIFANVMTVTLVSIAL